METEEKKCTKCGKTKPVHDFPIRAQLKSGRSNTCRECLNEASRKSKETARMMKKAKNAEDPMRGTAYWDSAPDAPEILPELLSCPFCGKKPKFSRFVIGRTSTWDIVCSCTANSRHYVVYSFDTPDDAASWWNRRNEDQDRKKESAA